MTLEEYLFENYSPRSVKGYLNHIKRFKNSIKNHPEKANRNDVLDYIGTLRKKQLHPKTIHNNLHAIKIYFYYLVAAKIRKDHPCQFLQLKDQINKQITLEGLYSKEKLNTIYENYQAENLVNQVRNKVILSLLIYQALTVKEIQELETNDIDLSKAIIKIKASNQTSRRAGNLSRTLAIKPQQILLFNNYLNEEWEQYHNKQKLENREDYFILSPSGKRIWSGAINRMLNKGKLKYERIIPIKIRQSVISNLLKENNDVRIVQVFAGHRRSSSTAAYKQTGLDELKIAIEKRHPLQ